jgi:putative endonuclease
MLKNTINYKFSRKKIGDLGEDFAFKYLKKNGYKIIERNFRSSLGEIDIIAKNKDYICFVEVKTRRENKFGNPEEAITDYKKNKLRKLALYFFKINKLNPYNFKIRFDVVAIDFRENKPIIEIIKNAF